MGCLYDSAQLNFRWEVMLGLRDEPFNFKKLIKFKINKTKVKEKKKRAAWWWWWSYQKEIKMRTPLV